MAPRKLAEWLSTKTDWFFDPCPFFHFWKPASGFLGGLIFSLVVGGSVLGLVHAILYLRWW